MDEFVIGIWLFLFSLIIFGNCVVSNQTQEQIENKESVAIKTELIQ